MSATQPPVEPGQRDPRMQRLFVCVALLMAHCWIDQQRREHLTIKAVGRRRASRGQPAARRLPLQGTSAGDVDAELDRKGS